MPLDQTHQHNSDDIMRSDAVRTPISPTGGSVTADQQAALDAADPPLDADHPPLTEAGGSLAAWVETDSVPGTLTVTPPDSEVDDLLNIVVPETYVDDSNYGRLIRAAYPGMAIDESIFFVALNEMQFKSAAGEGGAAFTVISTDDGGSVGISSDGILYSDGGANGFRFQAGVLGFFDKASPGASQQTLARPSGDAGDLWDILAAYGLVKAP